MTVNRERKKVWREATSLDMEFSSLDSVIAELQSYRNQYGAHTRIEKRHYDYSDRVYYAVMCERDETDQEMARRIREEERWEADKAARDRVEFERLKAKFGDK
jgi:hypothetical protein